MIELQVFCPPGLPRHCYVMAGADPARCYLVPVTLAGAGVDWSARREVPRPHPVSLGAAVADGPPVWSLRAAMAGGV